ncbi:OsmC family protein [Bacillus swezeyi]|uniref:OsmC family protein n=1 Tax=Bacillus swezeyi TaxID=1925020 RepID=UPI003F8B9AA2
MDIQWNQNGFHADLAFGRLDISSREEAGFRPYQLMIASIAACSGTVLHNILEKKRIQLKDMIIQAKEERIPEEAGRIKSIHLHFILKGEHLKTDQIQKTLRMALRNCAMVRSVENSIDIKETFEIQSCFKLSSMRNR